MPLATSHLAFMDGASTLLHQAAAAGNELLLTELLSQPGCPPLDQRDSLGLTPVHYAAALPSAACLRVLLEAGGQPNCTDSADMHPLHRAALCGSAECCRVLLLAGAEVDAPTEPGGLTPLLLAVSQGQTQCMQLLLKAGADCRWADAQGRTAAQLAVRTGHAEALQLLLGGEDEEAGDESVASSRTSCSSDGSDGGFPRGSGSTTDSGSDDWGSPQRHFASPQECDLSGRTLLHQAATEGKLGAVVRLRQAPGAAASRDGSGLTPFQAAAKAGQREAARLLLVVELVQQLKADLQAMQGELRQERQHMQQLEQTTSGLKQEHQQLLQTASSVRQEHQQLLRTAAGSVLQPAASPRRPRFDYKTWTKQLQQIQEERHKAQCKLGASKRAQRQQGAADAPAQPESPATPKAAAAAELAAALLLEEERAAAAAAAEASAAAGKKQSRAKQRQRQAAAPILEPEETADKELSNSQQGSAHGSESSTMAVASSSPSHQLDIAPSTPSRGTQDEGDSDHGGWQVSRRKGKKAGQLPPPPPAPPAPPKQQQRRPPPQQQVAVQRQQQQGPVTSGGAAKPASSSAALAALAAAAPAAAAVAVTAALAPAAPAATPPAAVAAALVPAADVPGSAGAAAAGEVGADAAVAELLDHLGISHLDVQPAAGESGGRASLGASSAGQPAAAAGQEPVAASSAGSSSSAAAGAGPSACPLAGLHQALLAELHCPITTEPMRDPVVAADGSSYERAAIEAWINRQLVAGQAPTSPLTGAPLASLSLRENRIARMLVASLQTAGQLPH